MKLSSKINIILLPVMVVVFSAAGAFSYNSQRIQLVSSLSDTVENELEHTSQALIIAFHELESKTYMMLENRHLQNYFRNQSIDSSHYYLKKELIAYAEQLELQYSSLRSFALLDSTGEEVVYYDGIDPFSEVSDISIVSKHIPEFLNSVGKKGIKSVKTTSYQLSKVGEADFELSLIKSFSPDQSLSLNTFSKGHKIYSFVMVFKLDSLYEIYHHIEDKIKIPVSVEIIPSNYSNSLKVENEITNKQSSGHSLSVHLNNELWGIKINLNSGDVEKLFKPYQWMFIVIVIVVTCITFIMLKMLIISQIIDPVVKLTKQVESASSNDSFFIEGASGNDEVSILTNKYIALISDLNNLAKYDKLTGLPNRNRFTSDLGRIYSNSRKYNEMCAVIFFDLDNFKHVNDQYGHQTGDMLLKTFSSNLVDSFVDFDWDNIKVSEFEFSRLAGDEFAIVVGGIEELDVLSLFSQRIIDQFNQGFTLDDISYDIGVSIGISVYPNDATNETELLKNADAAMYSAKSSNEKNTYRFYSEKLDLEIKRYDEINGLIGSSLENNDFNLVYMPIYDCVNGSMIGAEVLLRVDSPCLSDIGPAEFIPVAESSGKIKDIDYWVIEHALEQLSIWIEEWGFNGVLAINFSSWQLSNVEFVNKVEGLIKKYGVAPHLVEFEITETCFVPGVNKNIAILSELHDLGVKISLDDFGTGYTAFSQLIDYPIDTLKVDRMFVEAIDEDTTGKPLIDIIVEMARLYDLKVVAEGVETRRQFDYVQHIGCHQVQGYFLSKPLKGETFIQQWAKV
ncbi:bifunctional diguanylate cyclase/phosphodiesterase [Vibrio sp. ZSDE26]|uniref:Bifunctional diguanylate cyclase/phosphodiesterase n=1 Tax=Vibrio amylolyticus TaxID=2847292 RepID=A0A9X2BI10_9VIBR|nr:bifunctional diguanylate cyclase/phosphodiesterase [Vibrio amylolyticus]MCK6264501.1 bifunctional diguanylate cyclase/phosphodiesterase [Vibrio amylolyticus]